MPRGEVSETTVQPRAPKPLPKKAMDMRRRMSHWVSTMLQSIMLMARAMPRMMGGLAGEGERAAGAEEGIGGDAAEDSADGAAEGGQGCGEAYLGDGHVTGLAEVLREPGDEKPGEGVDAELADVDSDQHAVAEEAGDGLPGDLVGGVGGGADDAEAASVLDGGDLSGVDVRVGFGRRG